MSTILGTCTLSYLLIVHLSLLFFFFFNDPAPPEIYPLPLHAALPISSISSSSMSTSRPSRSTPSTRAYSGSPGTAAITCSASARSLSGGVADAADPPNSHRSEEHTSELQSQSNLVCRLLLEKKKKQSL